MAEKALTYPEISVLIPTRNGEKTLPELLAMLSMQTLPIKEICIADSASEDRTVDIAKQHGARVLHIDPDSFDHGGTRTMLSQIAAAHFLVFFTQDAIPTRRNSLEKLIQPLLNESAVATCYGRQLPNFGADFFASSLRKFNYPEKSQIRSLEDVHKLGLKTVFTSNSFACYKRESLAKIGYFKNGLIFGEDTIAVGRLLQGGERIAYVAEASVYHSHNYTPAQEFKRYFDIGVLHSSEKWFIETFGSAEGQGKKYIYHELQNLRKEKKLTLFPELLIRILFKFVGYKIGRHYSVLPKYLVTRLSLHNRWWNGPGRNKRL